MEDLSLLGNAAAVPIIIAITQFLKRNFNFRRKAEVMSLVVSLGVCFGWEFYYTPNDQLLLWWASGIIAMGKHVIKLLLISVATWLSATKSYDFFVGDKKRQKEIQTHIAEKETLKKKVLEMENGGSTHEIMDDMDSKIREILER